MKIPSIESVTTQEQGHSLAVEWQCWQSERPLSWKEMSQWSDFFSQVAEKFPDLTDEFKENGIL